MEVVRERCAGADVHKRTVVVHVITPAGRATRTFGTMTSDLSALVDWLAGHQVTDIAMESTGSYWKPVYNVLEARGLRPVVANAQHIKAVPGRKTDVSDAAWIADLHRHGLVPALPVQARRARRIPAAIPEVLPRRQGDHDRRRGGAPGRSAGRHVLPGDSARLRRPARASRGIAVRRRERRGTCGAALLTHRSYWAPPQLPSD